MKILAFDTSYHSCSAALLCGDQVYSKHTIAPMQQAQIILPMIENLLDQASLQLSDLNAIAYTQGPGSFTGIRLGSCVAQGLAFPWQLPIISISSLEALAQTAYLKQDHAQFLIAVDARMNQIYWGEYHINEKGFAKLIGSEKLCKPDEVSCELKQSASNNYIGIGDGWIHYQQVLEEKLAFRLKTQSDLSINAEALLSLAQFKYEKSEWLSVYNAIPVYLR